MVKINELRLGIYVDVPRADQSPFRIDEIEYMSKNHCKVGMNTGTYKVDDTIGEVPCHPLTWYFKDLSGIPLTTEILEKCGFDKCSDGFLQIVKSVFNWRMFIRSHENVYHWAINPVRHVELKYLHQLQNLYFALTGEELQVNLL